MAGFEFDFAAAGPGYSIYTNSQTPTLNYLEVWYDTGLNSNSLTVKASMTANSFSPRR
ncbi:MAG: hypothetical protein U1D30_25460 [Planctomycetota bacterium]